MTTSSTTATPGQCPESHVSRRRFLQGTIAAAGIVGLTELSGARVAFGAPTSHTIVVLSLQGGFDGLNAVPPIADPQYYALRPSIAVPASQAIKLDSQFGLHPQLGGLKKLWDRGDLAFLHGVGMPGSTRSHFADTEEMERAAPGTSLRTGWIDRALVSTGTDSPLTAVQVGTPIPAAAFHGPQPEIVTRSLASFKFSGPSVDEVDAWSAHLEKMYSGHDTRIAAPALAATRAVSAVEKIKSANLSPAAVYPADSELAEPLIDVARMVKLNAGVRFAAVEFNDWDMHDNLGRFDSTTGRYAPRVQELGDCLAAFADDLGDRWNDVTVVMMSEFGRRVKENGSAGTDHGNANTWFVAGGRVNGGKFYGQWPGLATLNRGDLRLTTDYRDVIAEVLTSHMGLSTTTDIFPGHQTQRLGFLLKS